MFCEIGICENDGVDSEKLENLEAPVELKEMLKLSKEWHLQREDHYNVFGMNLFDKKTVWPSKVEIFGDEENIQNWKDDLNSPNCAEEGWECFAVFSEYDYLFVCLTPGKKKECIKKEHNVQHEKHSFQVKILGPQDT